MDNSVQEILSKTIQFFKNKNFESPRLEAELLLASALEWDRIQLYLKFDHPLSGPELDKARSWVKRRSQGEPLAYITGSKFFYRRNFLVNPSVLIPRPESEIAVEWIVNQLKKNGGKTSRILDIGTGSGCLGLSILGELPNVSGVLVDKSVEALATAKSNAEGLGFSARTEFIEGDFLSRAGDLVAHRFDAIIANPPYLARGDSRIESHVLSFEPHSALFAEEEGFECIRTWSFEALPLLRPGGWMIFEIGLDQSDKAVQHFKEIGLTEVGTVLDLQSIPRFVCGKMN